MPKDYAISINDIPFQPRNDCNYKLDYIKIATLKNKHREWKNYVIGDLKNHTPQSVEYTLYRQAILNDLWFIVYFVLGIKSANHPFVVRYCQDIENGPKTMTLDVVSRGHFKTSAISIAETIQFELMNPEFCTILFAYKKGLAEFILASIKRAFESEFLIKLFPDRLYEDPTNHSPLHSIEKGIIIKRKNTTRKEASVHASGLVEGMSQGLHSERLVFDDIETFDMVKNIDVLTDCYNKFLMARYMNTKTDDDVVRILGTYYSHLGPIKRIGDEELDGKPMYYTRVIPATVDGTFDGKPILWTQTQLNIEKKNRHYPMQCLCNPTPIETLILKKEFLKFIDRREVPHTILKWMLIDYAGDNPEGREGSNWAFGILGVDLKYTDETGLNNIYILDAVIDKFGTSEVIDEIVRMYLRGGIIQALCIEKNVSGALELHLAESLKKRGRLLSKERGNLIILKPAGRDKDARIEKALEYPLNNGKIHILNDIPSHYKESMIHEYESFPYGYKDFLDLTAYIYDVLKDPKLSIYRDNVIEFPFNPPQYRMKTHVA